jgi:hypothetical protein
LFWTVVVLCKIEAGCLHKIADAVEESALKAFSCDFGKGLVE